MATFMDELTGAGYPRTANGPPSGGVVKRGIAIDDPRLRVPSLYKIPDGNDLIAFGTTAQHRLRVAMDLIRVIVDIPETVTATLTIDGKVFHTTTDGKGSGGTLELGDMAGRTGIPVVEAVVDIDASDATEDLNVRYWLVGVFF